MRIWQRFTSGADQHAQPISRGNDGYRRRELSVVFVDGFCRLLRVQTIAEGGPDEVSLKAATVLRWALDAGASGFLLVHNHPSGDVRPSESDRSLTHLLEMLAAGLDMTMLGHLIVARGQISKIEGNGARIRSS